jgi:hypothetical protein
MVSTIKFENGIHELVLKYANGFKHLNLISAKIIKGTYLKPVPYIEMKLLNDRHAFNLYSNLVPGTDRLNCYDLLSASSNIPALANEIFHTLKCIMPENVFDEDAEVEMEFEVE